MSARSLPDQATLRFLRLEAKRFLRAAHAADHPRGKDGGALKLAEAQHLLAREYGLANWAALKQRVAELAFARAGATEQRVALIDAICAWGWGRDDASGDDANRASPDLAEAMLAAAPPALVAGDFVLACVTGDVDAVRAALAVEPARARQACGPRGWEPLLYASYSVLAKTGLPRAARVVEVAQLLLAAGGDPNAHYAVAKHPDHTFPALYAAIAVVDNLALARALLEAGANPNDTQSLYHAAERWDTDALDLLVAHDVSPTNLSYCLLHKIDFNHAPGIAWFLDHGADPNARHPKAGESALHWAIKRAARPAVIDMLLAHGADPDARTIAGVTAFPEVRAWTPLDLALRLGRGDVVATLRARGATATPPTAEDAFVLACARADAAAAKAHLASDPGLLARLSASDRPLAVYLAHQNQGAAAALAVELGFDPEIRGWMGATALHWAACRGNAGLARALCDRGVAQPDVGGYFRTPLHAVLYCHWRLGDADYLGVLEALVAAGAVLPAKLAPTDDPALDAAVARLRGT